jgi:hypothetical protein
MRRRIALLKHFVRNPTEMAALFLRKLSDQAVGFLERQMSIPEFIHPLAGPECHQRG